jgi:hypothetical protein
MSSTSERAMTKSVIAVARMALKAGRKGLKPYSHPNSPKTFTQPQLFAMLTVRQFFSLDYRATVQLLADWSDLRNVLKIKTLPHWTTLQKAEARLLKKGASIGFWTPPSTLPATAA